MPPCRRGNSERTRRIKVKRNAVYRRLSAEFGLPVDINYGIGYRRPSRINRECGYVLFPLACESDVKVGVENKFSRAVALRSVSGKRITAARRSNKIFRRE